jgi:UDP-glucose 4-epimerase
MVIGFTGARGFIGSYLLRYISSRSAEPVRILLRNVRAGDEYDSAQIVYGDLLSPVDCERFVEGLDVIYYLAHSNTPVNSDHDQPNDALVNMIPLLNLLQAIQAGKKKPHVVYFSSGGAVYGRTMNRIPLKEEDRCEPLSSYAIQKLAAEHYLRVAAEHGHLTCAVLRVSNAYGVLLPRARMQGLIGVAINNVLHDVPVRIFGSLDNVRDYVHLSDLCTIAEKTAHSKETFTVLNVGSGRGHSVGDVLDTIRDCAGVPVRIEVVEDPQYGMWLTDWAVLDITKAKEQYQWSPAVDLSTGIGRMFEEGRQRSGVGGDRQRIYTKD